MSIGPFEMVIGIVLITTVGSIIRAKHGIIRRGRGKDREEFFVGAQQDPAETDRMRSEIKTLKERIAVLERIATENNRAVELDREIEKLR
jgi:hypothetical protein